MDLLLKPRYWACVAVLFFVGAQIAGWIWNDTNRIGQMTEVGFICAATWAILKKIEKQKS